MKRFGLLLGVFSVVALTGCPSTEVVCNEGTERCGEGCVDTANDVRNCGACGQACGSEQECRAGACVCAPGTTLCGAACVVLSDDARNCGACGTACEAGEVCEAGACKVSCSVGDSVRCGDSCVDPKSNPRHCGGCDVACAQGETCREGVCGYEAVASCFTTGQLVGFSASTGSRGPLASVGTSPGPLASYAGTLLVADGHDNRVYQAVRDATAGYRQVDFENLTGSVPNQVLVDAPYVYVINAGSGTLQVLMEGADGGVSPAGGGVSMDTVAELPLGANSYPEAVAKVGDSLWVPLYGGYGADAADAGQAVVQVSVANPRAPSETSRVSLKEVDLKPFAGGAPVARPYAITAHHGALYVALSNLNADTYAPEGPGLLARVDPGSGAVSIIDLGADDCLNPQWVAPVGDGLAVSCAGEAKYAADWSLESVEHAGLVLLDANDAKVAAWAAVCPGGADAGCLPMMPARFTVSGTRILLGDQSGGRVVVLNAAGGALVEERAEAYCPISATSGAGNVGDVLALP